jgi:hypothetical protein
MQGFPRRHLDERYRDQEETPCLAADSYSDPITSSTERKAQGPEFECFLSRFMADAEFRLGRAFRQPVKVAHRSAVSIEERDTSSLTTPPFWAQLNDSWALECELPDLETKLSWELREEGKCRGCVGHDILSLI